MRYLYNLHCARGCTARFTDRSLGPGRPDRPLPGVRERGSAILKTRYADDSRVAGFIGVRGPDFRDLGRALFNGDSALGIQPWRLVGERTA